MNPESPSFQPFIKFDDITPEIASMWWERSKNLSDNERAHHLQLGKILVWCLARLGKGTDKRLIRDKYGVELKPCTQSCAKIFRAVREERFSSLTEDVYDHLPVGKATSRLSKIETRTDSEIASIVMGVSGQHSLSRKSTDPKYPKRGIIYVMVTSADPECSKLGGSWNSDPYESARDMFKRGTPSCARNVPVWWEEVSDWQAAEKALHAPFMIVAEGRETFRVRALNAIKHCMSVGRQFAIPT